MLLIVEKLKILIIIESCSGGSAEHVYTLSSWLSEMQHDVHLIYSPVRADARFRAFIASHPAINSTAVHMKRAPHFSDVSAIWKITRYIHKRGPFDIVHGHSSKGGAIAALSSFRKVRAVVYTPHLYYITAAAHMLTKRKRLLYNIIEKLLSFRYDGIINVSSDEQKVALQEIRINKSKLTLIPNGIAPLNPVDRRALRLQWNLKEGDIAVGFIGRFTAFKRADLFLDAIAPLIHKFNRLRPVILGFGELRQSVHQKATALGIYDRIIWLENIPGPEAVQAIDILVLSSDTEGMPMVVIEAMHAGLPIVATRVGGMDMLVSEGENGYTAPPGNVDGLREGIEKLISNDELRKKMGAASLVRSREFTADTMAQKTLDFYRQLINNKQP